MGATYMVHVKPNPMQFSEVNLAVTILQLRIKHVRENLKSNGVVDQCSFTQ